MKATKKARGVSPALIASCRATALKRIGIPRTEEAKANMRAACANRLPLSDDVRSRISATLKGRKIPDDVRARMSAGQRARLVREAEAGIKRTHTEEAKAKMRRKRTGAT